jgi:hypothetical protein
MSVEQTLEPPSRLPREEGTFVRAASIARRRPLVWFFVFAYAFSWSLSLVYLIVGSGPVILNCGPFLAAVVSWR